MTVITAADVDRAAVLTDTVIDKIIEVLDAFGDDAGEVSFIMWVTLTRMLADEGWTVDELIAEVARHAASEGSA